MCDLYDEGRLRLWGRARGGVSGVRSEGSEWEPPRWKKSKVRPRCKRPGRPVPSSVSVSASPVFKATPATEDGVGS